MAAKVTANTAINTAMPSTLDLAEIYFATFGVGFPAPCEHLNCAVMRQFRFSTIERLRPVAEQLAAERADALVFEPGNDEDHPWHLVIGQAPARRRATAQDVLDVMRDEFGIGRWVHPDDLRRHILRRVSTCGSHTLHRLCIQLVEQGRGRVRGDEQDYAFRID